MPRERLCERHFRGVGLDEPPFFYESCHRCRAKRDAGKLSDEYLAIAAHIQAMPKLQQRKYWACHKFTNGLNWAFRTEGEAKHR